MANKPIVTVKLASANISKAVGPDVRVEIQISSGPVIKRIGAASKNKWLYQAPWTTGALQAKIKVSEVAEKYPESATETKALSASTSGVLPSGTASGTDSASVTVVAVGGDVPKTATSTFNFKWWVSSSVLDVIDFMRGKMTGNLSSAPFTSIKKKQDIVNSLGRNSIILLLSTTSPEWAAMMEFREQVDEGKTWDYKHSIKTTFGEWALDAPKGIMYRFDIWGNIHYGYIGRAIGFSEDLLLNAAGLAQVWPPGSPSELLTIIAKAKDGRLRDLDNQEDQPAIRLGMELWKNHGNSVTTQNILDGVRAIRSGEFLTKCRKKAAEGRPPKSFS